MTAISIILRTSILLAIVVPVLIWVVRRVREGTSSDREVHRTVDREIEHWRGSTGGTGI